MTDQTQQQDPAPRDPVDPGQPSLPDIVSYVDHWRITDPHRVAVEWRPDGEEPIRVTYAQLAAASNRVSDWLDDSAEGESADDQGEPIPILMGRGPGAIAAIIGSLRRNCAFVPIDPRLPSYRLHQVLATISFSRLLTDRARLPMALKLGSERGLSSDSILVIDEPTAESKHQPMPPADGQYATVFAEAPRSRAYVYFTSGSTGQPKAIEGCRRSLSHIIHYLATRLEVVPDDRFSQIASFGFDFSLKELLVPLVRGAAVCIAPDAVVHDGPGLARWLTESGVTISSCPTPLFPVLVDVIENDAGVSGLLESLRCLLISGDVLRTTPVLRFLRAHSGRTRLFNLYGPTESTVIKLCHEIEGLPDPERATIPLGRGIDGVEVSIRDEHGQAVAGDAVGEIWLESQFLARGYFGSPEETARAFQVVEGNGLRRYRTGDLARTLPGGQLEFVGRLDRQVKVQGNRVELEEIETALSKHPSVRESAVVAKSNEQGTTLTAFYSTSLRTSPGELSRFLAARLPSHMIPGSFREITLLPRLPAGKVDFRELRRRLATDEEELFVPDESALSDTELELQDMFQTLLKCSYVGPEDNFFEIGGHSVLAISLLARIKSTLDVQLDFSDFFLGPTIRELARCIDAKLRD